MTLLTTIKKIHLIGVGGIGVSAVAKLLLHAGIEVSGSDAFESEITHDLAAKGIDIFIGHDAQNLPDGVDLVIRSGAVPDDNPELAAARQRGVRDLTYFQFLGEYARDKRVVAVAGTHGKSTTTAMLAQILIEAGLDPTVIVGSKVPSFPDGNLRLGSSDLLVVEACEHEAHLLEFHPQAAIVTNIEADHLDYYRDLDHIRDTFREFASQVAADGYLITNADDSDGSADLTAKAKVLSVGFGAAANYRVSDIPGGNGVQRFSLTEAAVEIGQFDLHVPGKFNEMNAAMAATMALRLGVSAQAIWQALDHYRGIWRRFEIIGEPYGATVVSDYGHHPTAVAATLTAAKEFYPERKIVLLFQPHHRNRTRNLFDKFVESFDAADAVILPEIYDVTGREEDDDQNISSHDLVVAITKRDQARRIDRPVRYAQDLETAFSLLHSLLEPGSVALIMGAGDVDKLARRRA
ncbi:MAG: UDP-N-acetylmuramate--L-alanine ligase [Patescibacteria group bacterium]